MLTGVDFAREEFNNYTPDAAARGGPEQERSAHHVGTPDDGASVDESLRIRSLNRKFVAKALGIYAQDLIEVVPHWKLLAGLRWDSFEGKYVSPASADRSRSALPLGLALEQPVRRRSTSRPRRSRSYALVRHLVQHLGRALQLRRSGVEHAAGEEPQHRDRRQAGPVRRQPVEPGRGLPDDQVQRAQPRLARGPPIVDFMLSGERHATGVELDLAGRITPGWEVFLSYAWIPNAEIDEAAFGVTPGGERVGDRPSTDPQAQRLAVHDLPAVREGARRRRRQWRAARRRRSAIRPGSSRPATHLRSVRRVRHVSGRSSSELNANNVTNKLYADSLYTRPLHPRPAAHPVRVDDGALLTAPDVACALPMLLHLRAVLDADELRARARAAGGRALGRRPRHRRRPVGAGQEQRAAAAGRRRRPRRCSRSSWRR